MSQSPPNPNKLQPHAAHAADPTPTPLDLLAVLRPPTPATVAAVNRPQASDSGETTLRIGIPKAWRQWAIAAAVVLGGTQGASLLAFVGLPERLDKAEHEAGELREEVKELREEVKETRQVLEELSARLGGPRPPTSAPWLWR